MGEEQFEKFGKSKTGNFEVVGSAKGQAGQNALLIGCKVDMNEAKDELFEYLRNVKKQPGFKSFGGFIFRKQF